jgi:general secretion pathway protein G
MKRWRNSNQFVGFTIIELLVVIVVIGILAAITLLAYSGVQSRASYAVMRSDLRSAADVFEIYKVDNSGYPTDMSSINFRPSSSMVLQNTNATGGFFCINAYHKTDPTIRMSWNSQINSLQNGLCDSAIVGSPVGGTVPTAARGVNLMPGFERWALTGGASYNSVSKELVLGQNGMATSPIVRIDKPVSMYIGADFYATIASAYVTITPNGAQHNGSSYYSDDGITPVLNTEGYSGNGCAPAIAKNVWVLNNRCFYYGGPLVVYVRIRFIGASSGYASSDLIIKNPTLIVTSN